MSASTWGGSESSVGESYPQPLLKSLLKQMMTQFAAQGACIAFPDEHYEHLKIQMHVRLHGPVSQTNRNQESGSMRSVRHRISSHLDNDIPAPPSGRLRHTLVPVDDVDEIQRERCELFAKGTLYQPGHDLIGYAWSTNDAYIMTHEEYLIRVHRGHPLTCKMDILPASYLVVPVREPALNDERRQGPGVVGVIVLYRTTPGPENAFQPRNRSEAFAYAERVALYLQNDRLQRAHQRVSSYLRQLQTINTAFPGTIQLKDLLENIYHFSASIADVASMQITLYDRDTEKIYEAFAVHNGVRNAHLDVAPLVLSKQDCPVWWHVAQVEKRPLMFSPAHDSQMRATYAELLAGAWGEQFQVETFLLLPMKMFNRVIGSLRITSLQPAAYQREQLQVLETMLQTVAVSIENAKLYDRDHYLLQEGRQREAELAAINSALQSIGATLNVRNLLNNFLQSVASLIKVEMGIFFQPTASGEELIAQAVYGLPTFTLMDDGSGAPPVPTSQKQEIHDDLINGIHIPFKGTALEQLVTEGFFQLEAQQLEELAQNSNEGGKILLLETRIPHMLMVPMTYQDDFVGILAVPSVSERRVYRPKEVGTLLALCAQATSALHNARLFQQKEVAFAELERMDKLKDEFMVTASHELGTPLSAIRGYASLLKRQGARITPQNAMRYATKIAESTEQLADLVMNMTEATKIGGIDKKLDLQMGLVQVRSAAEIARDMLTVKFEQKIIMDINPQLWVKGDAAHVRQVMTNLIENAAKYSPPHGTISIHAQTMMLSEAMEDLPQDQVDHTMLVEHKDMSVVLIRVVDQGEGILPEDRERIFEKFVRAPRSLTTTVRGSGLGLYICRRYIEAMGGKLWLEQSIANQGSTFSFYLPRIEEPVEQEKNG